jgi:2,5-diketo-D-gluconate reductase A
MSATVGPAPTRPLVHGAAVPALGLGTWAIDDRDAPKVVASAIAAGYRLIDTASHYGNEVGVGLGLRASGIPREHIFVTTKLTAAFHGRQGVRHAFHASCRRLGVEYLDLLLIHWPNPAQDRYVEAWEGLAALLDEGCVRAIGVSNFEIRHLARILDATGVIPDLNQIQLSPWLPRVQLREFHTAHGIVTGGWTPLAKGGSLLAEPAIVDIAARHGRTAAQVVLRWHVEIGAVPIPKSSDQRRLRDNLDVFDFSLLADEVATITALDRGGRPTWDADTYGI